MRTAYGYPLPDRTIVKWEQVEQWSDPTTGRQFVRYAIRHADQPVPKGIEADLDSMVGRAWVLITPIPSSETVEPAVDEEALVLVFRTYAITVGVSLDENLTRIERMANAYATLATCVSNGGLPTQIEGGPAETYGEGVIAHC